MNNSRNTSITCIISSSSPPPPDAAVHEKVPPAQGYEVILLDNIPSPQDMEKRAARKLHQFLVFPGQIQDFSSFVEGLGDCNYLVKEEPQSYILTTEGYAIPRLVGSSVQSHLDRHDV